MEVMKISDDVTLDVKFQLSTLDDREWRDVYFDICGYYEYSDDDASEVLVGSCKGFTISLPTDHDHLAEIADEISDECFSVCSEFQSFDECETLNYLVLTSMEIDKQFRGNGIGLKTMGLLSEYFWNYTILIRPHPIKGTCDNVDDGIKKLQKYWMQSGFKQSGESQVFFKECI